MIKTTLWQPDTCECKLEYQWDTEQNANNRTFTGTVIHATCPRHTGAPNPNALFSQVKGDNNLVNDAKKIVTENHPTLTKTLEDGRVRIDSAKVQFFLNLERVLEITVPSYTAQQKNSLKNQVGTAIGEPSRVLVK